jgi:hypothetical protein
MDEKGGHPFLKGCIPLTLCYPLKSGAKYQREIGSHWKGKQHAVY